MGELLDQIGGWQQPRKGQLVEGVVMRVDQDGILVNIGGKSEGFIPWHEARMLAAQQQGDTKVGATLEAYVLRTESDESTALLSYDLAKAEQGWRLLQEALQSGQPVDGVAVGSNKGGLVVEVEGVQGFVPLSQLAPGVANGTPGATPDQRRGQRLRLKVLEVDRPRRRAILSERAAWQEWRQQQKERLLQELREGEVREGWVTSVTEFGAFVDLGGADGLIHISELSWRPVRSAAEVVKVGDHVEVYVLRVDSETKKIALSLRRLQPSPWETISNTYHVGQVVEGTITRLVSFGAFARVDNQVEGLIHISELSRKPIQHPREAVKEGQVVPLKVLRIEPERRRLALSLRQALDEVGQEGPWSGTLAQEENVGTGESHG